MAPCDPTTLPFAAAQAVIDAIWSDMGLRYPPAAEPLPRQASVTIARANRLAIWLAERTPSWCVLHELAQDHEKRKRREDRDNPQQQIKRRRPRRDEQAQPRNAAEHQRDMANPHQTHGSHRHDGMDPTLMEHPAGDGGVERHGGRP